VSSTGPTTKEVRSAKGARTRARLVAAAKEVFEDSGFLEARISDISERAGLSHGSFYHYFDSKDQVFLEVARAQGERFGLDPATGDRLLSGTGDGLTDGLREAIGGFLELYRGEARLMGVIEQVARYHEPVRELRAAQRRQYAEQAEAAIRAVQRRGLADLRIDPRIVAPALVGMMMRFAEMWLVQGILDCDPERGADTLSAVCIAAMGLRDPLG
jgi:AcrR family transcriptional regulator